MQVANVQVDDCIMRVNQWLASNRFRLNSSTAEITWCASSRRHSAFDQLPLVVDQAVIDSSLSVRELGVQLRADISISDHFSAVNIC